jgi:hypothetical protein
MFTVGSTDLYVHKYIGSNNPPVSQDLTQPHYDQLDPTNIQDLLFLENRDRKYDTNIYRLRGHYNVQNLDFDLSQFGLFLTSDVIFVTVHYNDMIDVIGRKLMVGDVFELPHLTDFHPLNQSIPIGLRRYYQITDANYASEGFSQTWWPHLWRIKCEPLTNSQEFANILQQPINKDNYMGDWDPTKAYELGYTVTYNGKIYTPTQPVPPGTLPTDTNYWQLTTEQNLIDVISTYNKNLEINQAVIDEAARIVPKMGYDRSQLYVAPTFVDGFPAPPKNVIVPAGVHVYPTGVVEVIHSSQYINSSNVVRFKSNSIINPGTRVILETSEIAPTLTSGGSGQVYGLSAIAATLVSSTFSIPYGTADNTYASADQYIEFVVTTTGFGMNDTVIPVLTLTSDMAIDLVVEATTMSPNGTVINVFPPNTRVVSFDTVTNTFTVNNTPLSGLTSGQPIMISANFTGTVSDEMNYRADCDPRFTFIRRSSPRSFGYIAGYNSGDEYAPNGEPLIAGIAFPASPKIGDYSLRLDFLPQKLFRFDGKRWIEISRNVRNVQSFTSEDQSQLSTFINNDTNVTTAQGTTVPSRQSLSQALRITPD